MNPYATIPPSLSDRTQINSSLSLSELLHRQLSVQTNVASIDQLAEVFESDSLQLGELINTYYPPDSPADSVTDEQRDRNFYIVCRGHIRLLCFDAARQRDVSVQVLKAGDMFGGDDLVLPISWPYRAIAAGPCQIARMPLADLPYWLDRIPELRTYLQTTARQREQLIFCKTLTDLRHLTSQQIQQLLPLLTDVWIPAGTRLVDASLGEAGHCWLRQGTVQSQTHASKPLQMGESWGYLDTVPQDWVAQTDLLIYKLPLSLWRTAASIAPSRFGKTGDIVAALDRPPGSSVLENDCSRPAPPRQPTPSPPVAPPQTGQLVDSQSTQAIAAHETEAVAFPRPVRVRLQQRLWPRYPFIQQQSSSDCSVACLAMVALYWGQRLSLNYLRNLAGVGRSGASLKHLAVAAERIGLHARPVRASLNRLVTQNQPWIAHWQGDHYVVVYWVRGDRVLIADPARGKQTLSRQVFLANWTGYALLLDPSTKLHTIEGQDRQSLWRFGQLLLPYRSLLGQIILTSLLIQVFGLITPLFTQVILDQVVVQKSLSMLHVFALGLAIFSVWRIGMIGVRQYLLDYFSNRLDLTLVSGFISHTLMLPLKFFESRQVGDIITRIQENQKIQRFLVRQSISTWLDALMAIVYIGLMAYYNWHLTLLVLALIPPIVLLTLGATPFLKNVSRGIFNETAEQNSLAVEMITGLATVKAAAAEREIRWRWEERLIGMLNAQFKGQKLANGLQVAGGLINALGSAGLLWYGATLVIQDQLTIGQFVAFNMLIGSVIGPVLQVVGVWDELQEVLISVERLNDVFSAAPEESPSQPMLLLPAITGDVRFEDVTFSYDAFDDRNTLQNLAFHITAGQTVAIVGRSGSGKTTLVKLLQGLYHPTRGRVLVDGHDVRHVSPPSLRSQLGVVPQECFLFSGTILENIQLFRPEFSLEQVIEVAKLAEAHAFIQELPLGYNTKVGERGANLSGGQRQRIAIARALLGNPAILILDEATSSLDTESERRFQQNLARISRDRTTFIIAHRLSTIQHADRILVLDRGVLVEQGTHTELITLQGLYYHLARQQLNL